MLNPQGFLKRRSPQEAEILRQLYAETFPDLYRFSVQNLEYKMEVLEAFVITQSTRMMQGLIPPKVRGCIFLPSTLQGAQYSKLDLVRVDEDVVGVGRGFGHANFIFP